MSDPLSAARVYADVVRYALMGEHRTASPVDLQTSRWICDELCAAGIDARCAPWPLRQFQLQACRVDVYGQRIDAFHLWHPTSAGPVPISSHVVRTGGGESVAGKFALVRFADNMVTSTSNHAGIIAALADAGAIAIIGCTPHESGELYGQNAFAPHNQTPWPVPVAITFLSTSGHEIGHMGIHDLMRSNVLPSAKETVCWLHLGASIATRGWSDARSMLEPCGPEPSSWLFASQDMLRHTAHGFRELGHLVPKVYERDHGEIRWILEAGYSAYSLMGPHRFFHLANDGPEVINPDLLEKVGRSIIKTFDSVLDTSFDAMT